MKPSGNAALDVYGAGLAGSLLSVLLARAGWKTTIFEKRPDLRKTKIVAGRSINLAISVRGLTALDAIGLKSAALDLAIPMPGRFIHHLDGSTDFQPYGKAGQAIHSISRGGLNALLLDAAERAGVTVQFEKALRDVNWERSEAIFKDEKSGAATTRRFETIIGTDGAGSALRQAIARQPGFSQTIEDLDHCYKELCLPPAADGRFQLEKNALHIWPRRRFMLIALPNLDGSFTCTLFLPITGADSFASLSQADDVTRFFAKWFPDIAFSDLAEQFFANPTGQLSTLRCMPWHVTGSALLLGDAAHAIVPFYGQGMNCAFEDCALLLKEIAAAPSWQEAFARFAANRKPDADAIATMALENFVEMRDKVEDRHFLLKKQVAGKIGDRFPDQFVPQYTLVTFTNEPYRQAMKAGRLQDALLEKLCAGLKTPDDLNWDLANTLVKEYARDLAKDVS